MGQESQFDALARAPLHRHAHKEGAHRRIDDPPTRQDAGRCAHAGDSVHEGRGLVIPARLNVPTGTRFGRLTVVGEAEPRKSLRHFLVECDCGTQLTVWLGNLRFGTTRSCGCLHLEVVTKHGQSWGSKQTAEYRAWENMISRCTQPSYRDFRHYGGRGISVCQEWRHSFETFFAYMSLRPTPQHSVDRIDNDKNYEPGNVRWATKREQSLNQRRYKRPAATAA